MILGILILLALMALLGCLLLWGTTQTCKCTLIGDDFAINFTAACTDDAYTELKDSVNTLSLYEVLKGKVVKAIYGYYTAGSGKVRVRGEGTQKIKMMECLPMIKGQHYQPCQPFQVQDQDVIECFSTVAGS